MNGNRPLGLFIAGTDTDVGKTYVTALLARKIFLSGIRVGVYKPVATGCREGPGGRRLSDDAVKLWEAAGRPSPIERVCPLRLLAPLAPGTAAGLEGKTVELKALLAGAAWWSARCKTLLVEGVGGVLSPLGRNFDNLDLIVRLKLPVVLVAPNRIGAVNQVRSSVAALKRRRSVKLHGIVLSALQPTDCLDPSAATNAIDIRHWLQRDGVDVPLHELNFGEQNLAPSIDI
jgi:dethiobiotin synthetase